jgi:L-asparaginase II
MLEDSVRSESIAPVVVRVVRGAIVEAQHRADVAVVGEGGRLRGSLGSPDRLISIRSAIKPFTACAVLLAVEAAGLEMTDEAVALSAASHAGAEEHLIVARSMIARYNLDSKLLVHGRPRITRGGVPGEEMLQHMCSGQHLSLLLMAKALGLEAQGYDRYEHPVQVHLRTIVGELLSIDLNKAAWGVDGCAMPTYAVPLRTAAEGARRWANPENSGLRPELVSALTRVRAAVGAFPRLIAGVGDLDTDLIRGGRGKVVAKQGAEGLCIIGAPGVGIAIHADDGDHSSSRCGRVTSVCVLQAAGAEVAHAPELDPHRVVTDCFPDPRGGHAASAEAAPALINFKVEAA